MIKTKYFALYVFVYMRRSEKVVNVEIAITIIFEFLLRDLYLYL